MMATFLEVLTKIIISIEQNHLYSLPTEKRQLAIDLAKKTGISIFHNENDVGNAIDMLVSCYKILPKTWITKVKLSVHRILCCY